jgi:large subunit ribosomal protein L6
MSRIGKAPITVPGGVDVRISGQTIVVKGPKGELSRELSDLVSISADGDTLQVERVDDSREARAMHGLMRSLVANMVTGVTDGFRKELDIVGVGYRAAAKGSTGLELALGFSHPVNVTAPEGIEFVVPQPTRIEVHGIDKQLVGQVAADIRAWRKPEPYKGKGVRYVDEHVRRKAGKAGK